MSQAYNAARNDVTNDIINQATIDLAKTPSEYNWQAAGEWRDFYGVVFPGCEEGELNEVSMLKFLSIARPILNLWLMQAWRTSYEDEYKRYRLTILKDTYDGVWADRAPLSPSSGAAAALREVKRRCVDMTRSASMG